MFGPPGHAYVYFTYGMHFCFNAVCCHEGVAEAVLVRAIEPAFGIEAMLARRAVDPKNLSNGPAKFCAAMQINRALDGFDICDAGSALFIAENPAVEQFRATRGPVVQTTRIGITKAADWPLRWYLGGSDFVSKRAAKDKGS
jgi:DNA-3-methyladenine glycosylase